MREKREPFRKHLLAAALLIVFVSLATATAEFFGLFRGFETTALDSLLAWKNGEAKHVLIVGISNEDYQNEKFFRATSPLDPEQVEKIVDAVVKGKPAVVGIDLDTSSHTVCYKPLQRWQLTGPKEPPIIWARDAEPLGENVEKVLPGDVLGTVKIGSDVLSGMVVLPRDPDGIVRRYRRVFYVPSPNATMRTEIPVDSLPWAIVKRFCLEMNSQAQTTGKGPKPDAETEEEKGCAKIWKMQSKAESEHEDLVLNFSGDRYRFRHLSAEQVLQASHEDYWARMPNGKGKLDGKIVLIGGLYHAARDDYVTPVGAMAGVELMAQAIESDLEGGGIRLVNHFLMLFAEFGIAALLVALEWHWAPFRDYLFVRLLAAVALILTGSLVAFHSLAYWANFVPIVFAVILHQLHQHVKKYRSLQDKVRYHR